nr:hypothetical protein [Tanacetum cinerariifolium]
MTDVKALPVCFNDQCLPRIRWVQTGYLKFSAKGTKREVFGMPVPGSLITADFREVSYYQEYLANVVKHRWFLSGEPAKPNPTTQKVLIHILQYLIHLRMCKDVSTKMMKMFLLVENLRQQNLDNREFSANDTKREVFGMPIPGSLITADIREASYYQEYLANVTKHRRFLAGETRSAQDSHAPKSAKSAKFAKKPKPTTQKDRINILHEDGNPARANIKQALGSELIYGCFWKTFEVLNNVFEHWVFNSLVHSSRALSALRRFGLRTASTAAKPCQGDSSEFYLITSSIHINQRGTVVLATLFNESKQRHLRSFITNINLQESRWLQLLAKKDVILQLHAHTSNLLSMTAKRPTTQLPQL